MRRLACLLLLALGARGEGDAPALAHDTDALLAELDAETLARREGGRGAEAETLALEVDALRRRAAGAAQPAASALPEVHAVRLQGRGSSSTQVRTSVHVTVVGRPVILVLSSVTPVWWDVDVAAGAEVCRVLTAGADQTVRGIRGRAEPVEDAAFLDADPLTLEGAVEAKVGARLATLLRATADLVVGPGNPEWQAQHVHADAVDLYWRSTRARRAAQREELKKVRFGALCHWRDPATPQLPRVSFGEWTPLGPLLARQDVLPDVLAVATAAVRDEERGEVYLLRHGVLIRYALPSGPPEVLRVPDTLPQVREPCALAVDTRRHRLLLATRHDHGYLYAMDLKSREWSLVNDLDDVDAAGMAYDEQRDAILCLEYGERNAVRLHRFSPLDGRRQRDILLRLPPLAGSRPLVAACVKGRLLLLCPPAPELAHRDADESLAFVVEPHSGEVLFAARTRAWEEFAPLAEAQLEDLWNELVLRDETQAGRAMRALAGQGHAAVTLLARRLRPELGAAEELGRYVALLADDDAMVRDLAQHRLIEAGPRAEEFLAGLDSEDLPPEARRRVGAAPKAVGGPGRLRRNLRAIQVLEWIESPAAESLLRDLAAKGEPRRCAAAGEALSRIDRPRR